ncbi:hypothetical protein V8G54_020415 [Vigna mungo]|uniref:Uncharacterized protein n=1 Tax=Vigna mungo TaxID=3915 RepID=A0AAQ3RWD9_VIGMU
MFAPKGLDSSQIHFIRLRKSALASLQSGNKKLALNYARELKLVTHSREKCSSLLSRVEEVLGVISDAESTKKVAEAIQIGARAIKENKISVEDVDLCLRDIQESIDSHKEVEKILEQTPSYVDIEDEDIEEEFKKLELTVGKEAQVPTPEKTINVEGRTGSKAADLISDAFSNLKLSDHPAEKPGITLAVSDGDKITKKLEMEAVIIGMTKTWHVEFAVWSYDNNDWGMLAFRVVMNSKQRTGSLITWPKRENVVALSSSKSENLAEADQSSDTSYEVTQDEGSDNDDMNEEEEQIIIATYKITGKFGT